MAEEVAEHRQGFTAETVGQIIGRNPADQEFGDLARLQAAQPGADLVDQAEADLVGGELAFENPVQRFLLTDDIGQQVVHLQHVDITLTHLGDEIEVVALGLGNPEHIVEQQFVAVVRGQPLVGQAGGAHHHLA